MLFCHYDALHTIFFFFSEIFRPHPPPLQVGTKKYVDLLARAGWTEYMQ